MPRVVHFDIQAVQIERAIKFYSEVFGWQIKKVDLPMDYWLITTGKEGEPGIDGGMSTMESDQRIINSVDVPSVDKFAEKIVASGGQILMPKMAIPGVGYYALCLDTEGNKFGIIEMDSSAA